MTEEDVAAVAALEGQNFSRPWIYDAFLKTLSDENSSATIYLKSDSSELEYLQQSFELRYPDADDFGDAWGIVDVDGDTSMGLKRLIDWVDHCTDEEFVRDFEQYFHKQYTLRYYLLVIVLG